MTRADQLRQALDIIDAERAHEQISGYVTEESPIIDAARCWLRLQEADEQMVEKVYAVLAVWAAMADEGDEPFPESFRIELKNLARAVLAAITEEGNSQ